MNIPMLDVPAQNAPFAEALREAFDRTLASGRFILGPEVSALEAELAAYVGANHAIGVSSGTDALIVALMALGMRFPSGPTPLNLQKKALPVLC